MSNALEVFELPKPGDVILWTPGTVQLVIAARLTEYAPELAEQLGFHGYLELFSLFTGNTASPWQRLAHGGLKLSAVAEPTDPSARALCVHIGYKIKEIIRGP